MAWPPSQFPTQVSPNEEGEASVPSRFLFVFRGQTAQRDAGVHPVHPVHHSVSVVDLLSAVGLTYFIVVVVLGLCLILRASCASQVKRGVVGRYGRDEDEDGELLIWSTPASSSVSVQDDSKSPLSVSVSLCRYQWGRDRDRESNLSIYWHSSSPGLAATIPIPVPPVNYVNPLAFKGPREA